MRSRYVYIIGILWCVNAQVLAQKGIDSILTAIAQHNKTIAASKQYASAQSLSFRTGLFPANPFVEFDYMKGTPAEAGNQRDFAITQSLDFPSTYFIKSRLAGQQTAQVQTQVAVERQNVLLEAKLTCLDLIYQNKKKQELTKRVQRMEALAADFEKRLSQGDVSILDVNKAKLQLINLQHELRENTTAINLLNQKLTELNGGIEITLSDTLYPSSPTPAIDDFANLDSLIEANDPIVQTYKQQKQIYEKQEALTKALTLPKLEAGYHYQAILGQTYKGVHLGLTIPLWENKNTVQFGKAQVVLSELQIQQHRVEHYRANKGFYEQYQNLQKSLTDYEQYLSTIQTTALLDKALRLGQISTIEYFLEVGYMYTTYDRYLQIENEYHEVIARLYKYQL
jgi:outer membrane protein, heavy metal efflux system